MRAKAGRRVDLDRAVGTFELWRRITDPPRDLDGPRWNRDLADIVASMRLRLLVDRGETPNGAQLRTDWRATLENEGLL